jgi:hypothetical protein
MSDPAPVTAPQKDLIDTLAGALTSRFGLKLTKADTIEQLLAPVSRDDAARFLLRPQLRAKKHFDLDLERFRGIFICDGYLGTLGIADLLEVSPQAVVEDVERQVQRLVDRAAQFRQILLLDAEERNQKAHEPKDNVVAMTVELVLVVDAPAASSSDPIGQALARLARETTYLRTIGVSVLYSQSGGFDRADLRRAFPWLLIDTREWFSHATELTEPLKLQCQKAWKLRIEQYRLSGAREIHFAPGCTLHVIHGYNGSGKSTVTEALELLLTGYIERLEEAGYKNYFDVVRHRPTQIPGATRDDNTPPALPTQVILYSDEKEVHTITVSAEGQSAGMMSIPSPEARPPAALFRLDQRFMDKLVTRRDADRYELFLRAFFPREYPLLEKLDKTRTDAEQAFTDLPEKFSKDLPKDGEARIRSALDRLQWTQRPGSSWEGGPLAVMESVLPLTAAQVRLLARLNPTVAHTLSRWDSDPNSFQTPEQDLAKCDNGLESLAGQLAQSILPNLETSLRVLKEFENWEASAPQQILHTFEQSVGAWLELEALADLISKYHDVTATLSAAREKGWHPTHEEARLLPAQDLTPQQIGALREAKRKIREDTAKARDAVEKLAGGKQTPGAAAASGQQEPLRRTLRDDEIAALNMIGSWLESVQQPPTPDGLGKFFADALRTGNSPTLPKAKNVKIGRPGGLQPAIDELQALLEAAKQFDQAWKRGAGKLMGQYQRARQAWITFSELQKMQADIGEKFLERIGEQRLNTAMNELLALFKPAAWGYQDITLEVKAVEQEQPAPAASSAQNTAPKASETATRGRGQFRLLTRDGSPAELRLNTAELNSFVVALFLLCAPRVDNPLRLIVLDDPLQNMDEMTVNALSRGLAKLVRILPSGWQILALFHGDEDLHRIHEETRSAVYLLPWLTTRVVASRETIGIHPNIGLSNWNAGLQSLKDLLAPSP